MHFFWLGVGLKEVIRRHWPIARTLQHLGKVKQFSWIWLRRRAVRLESSRRGSSAFCRVVEPRPRFNKLLCPCKLFLSLPKYQICFQDWDNSGSFLPLQADLHVYFATYTCLFTKGRYLESSLWQSLDLIKMSVQWIKPKERIARKHKSFLPLPFSEKMRYGDLPWQPQPHHPGRWPVTALRGGLHGLRGWQVVLLLLTVAWSHLQGFELHRRVGVFQQGNGFTPADSCQVNTVHIQEDVTWDQ